MKPGPSDIEAIRGHFVFARTGRIVTDHRPLCSDRTGPDGAGCVRRVRRCDGLPVCALIVAGCACEPW
jgi:hypothetical protein